MMNGSDPNKLVSVIIPAYNREKYISTAIESVMAQTYRLLEIIVIDDGSTDGTGEIVRSYGDRLRYHLRPNGGPAAARNCGVTMSQGAYLSFLDSDDVWPKDKLQSQMEHLAWHADIDYVIGQVEYFLDPGASPPAGFRRRLLEGPSVGRLVQAMLVRRRAFDRVGLFDEKLTTAEDVDWFCRANDLQLTMAVLPQTMARIRVHGDNTVHRAEQNNRNLLLALRRSVSRKHAAAATT